MRKKRLAKSGTLLFLCGETIIEEGCCTDKVRQSFFCEEWEKRSDRFVGKVFSVGINR